MPRCRADLKVGRHPDAESNAATWKIPQRRIEGDSTHKNTAKVLASHSTRKMAVTSHNFHDSSLNGGEMI